jgi:hypothetical protein
MSVAASKTIKFDVMKSVCGEVQLFSDGGDLYEEA